ncbi:UNVERIFIED_CONTAM: putative carboxylesterase 2 [Sesamum angustifolium]|uniref:Carboxylesterase 2 n=1 Tax=Sesamum angustifolium TaxID=2727405 RepID=A0AAW2NYM0_9LAMI
MASNSKEIAADMSPFFRLYKDNTIDRLGKPQVVPPSDDPEAAVISKDVVIHQNTGVSVRIFAPGRRDPSQKLPLAVYIHGGAYCVGSPSNPVFHNFVSKLVEKSNAIAVSIAYRLAPESPLPIAYEDSWAAFQWIAAHANGKGPDPWLNEAGTEQLLGVEIVGVFLVHPFFAGNEVAELYKFLCPTSSGRGDDPRLNPAVDPRIRKMAGRRVAFFLAEKDMLREGARGYYEGLKKSEWRGEVEMFETEGEGHCFHLFNTNSEKAEAVMDRLVGFLNRA